MPVNPTGYERSGAGECDGRALHALLAEQTEVVALLARAATEMQSGILERDSAKIEAAIAQESDLADRLAALEKRRSAWVADCFSDRIGQRVGNLPSLSDLLPYLPPEQAGPIQVAAERLLESVDELHRINRQNADLIYYSLSHLQTLLGALAGDGSASGLYGPRVAKGNAPSRALVDWRV